MLYAYLTLVLDLRYISSASNITRSFTNWLDSAMFIMSLPIGAFDTFESTASVTNQTKLVTSLELQLLGLSQS